MNITHKGIFDKMRAKERTEKTLRFYKKYVIICRKKIKRRGKP